jgi:hypothetical protein
MFPSKRLSVFHVRKQELLVQSEVNRRLMTAECAAIQQRLEWLDRIVIVARRLRPFVSLAAPLLGAWTARRENRERTWIGTIATALPMAARFASAMQQFIQR